MHGHFTMENAFEILEKISVNVSVSARSRDLAVSLSARSRDPDVSVSARSRDLAVSVSARSRDSEVTVSTLSQHFVKCEPLAKFSMFAERW